MLRTKPLLSIPEQIVEMIKDSIISGHLKLGDRLPNEAELADQFGVSRTTLREALDQLESQHLITTRQGKQGGHFITNRTTEDVVKYLGNYVALSVGTHSISLENVYEMRLLFEVKGCGLAALRRTPEELIDIQVSLPPKDQFISSYQFHHQDIAFHRAVAHATHNDLMIITMNSFAKVQEVLAIRVNISTKVHGEELETLYLIYQAILEQDQLKAEEAMAKHLRFFKSMTKGIHI